MTIYLRFIVLLVTGLLAFASFAASLTSDVQGSRDNPILKRYEGSAIAFYEKKAFAEFKFVLGPLPKDPASPNIKSKSLEGAYTRLAYIIPENRSPLEVLRNYQEELKAKGGTVIYECKETECGQISVGRYIYPESKISGDFNKALLAADVYTTISDERYSVIALSDSGTYVSVLSYVITNAVLNAARGLSGRTIAVVDIVEPKAREQKMVTVQASDMANAISSNGKIALYGIFFDSNKADIKAESDATLAQIAKLLKDNNSMHLLVVGHTDNVGGYGANLDLSQRRAASVVSFLVGKHGIGKERLLPVGVSFASPIASNSNEEGRSKNRRVELVENASLTR